ncbi:MAG: hypothetical protein ACF8PN_06450 [Phycisphaerales bacterium]
MTRTHWKQWTLTAATVAVAGWMMAPGADAQLPKAEFDVKLQTSGDWSGSYCGEDLGLNDHTIILYENSIFPPGRNKPKWPDNLEELDFDLYYSNLEAAVLREVPEGFDGIVIIDIERYPVSLYQPWNREYRDPRIEHEIRLDPGISYEEAERRAAERHLPLSQALFGEGVRRAQELRPDAKWGLYGQLSSDRNLPIDDHYRWINDQSAWLWQQVDVITRPIYSIWYETDQYWPRVRDLMSDKVAEAVRLADEAERVTGREKLAYAYCHFRVAGSNSRHAREWLTDQQVQDMLDHSWMSGADGALIWQVVRENRSDYPTEPVYINYLEDSLDLALANLGLGAYAELGRPGRDRLIRRGTDWAEKGARAYRDGQIEYGDAREKFVKAMELRLHDKSDEIREQGHDAARNLDDRIKRKGSKKNRRKNKKKRKNKKNSGAAGDES